MKQALCLLFAAALVLQASAAPNEQKQIQELYRRGLQGDKQAVLQCIEKLEAVLQRESSNQLARVYLGSAYTLQSRDLSFGPKKLRVLRRGLGVMDEAVAAAPNEPKVRLARALTTSALPGFFGRAAQSREDFELLAERGKKAPESFEAGDLQIIFYNAGMAAKAAGDNRGASESLRTSLRYPIDEKLAEKTRAALGDL